MSAKIIYRNSTSATIATSTIAKNSALSNDEMDGNLRSIALELDLKATIDNPIFTGTVTLPGTTSIGGVTAAKIGFLDGATSNIQTQINSKSPVASPTFTGVPAGPTAVPGTNTTQLATTEFVTYAVSPKAPITSPTFTGVVTAPQFVSTIADGTAPLVVTSTTKVTNLNADAVDGFSPVVTPSANTIALRDSVGNLNALNLNTTEPDVMTASGSMVFRNAGNLTYCSVPSAIRTYLGVPTGSGTSTGSNTGDQTTISGNAGSVTNGVYTIGDQSIGGNKTFTLPIVGALTGTATYVSSTQQTNVITGSQTSMTIAQSNSTNNGSFICKASGASDVTGTTNLAGMTFSHDSYSIKMGVRADGMFGIGGWSRAAWSWYSDAAGNTVSAGNMSGYSDPRLKENAVKISDPFALINSINGYTFNWNSSSKLTQGKWGKRDYGVLSSEVKMVMPEVITESIADEETGLIYDTVDYTKLVPVLLEAIKILKREVDLLKAK
jgi:hypothetical protein